jgi:hypothetical protein
MPTSEFPEGGTPYGTKEIEILSYIQDASMKAALPIIIAIFKHLSSSTGLVDKDKLKLNIMNDPDLKSSLAGSTIIVDAVGLDNSIKILISQGLFLISVGDKIELSQRGKDAAALLGLVESK